MLAVHSGQPSFPNALARRHRPDYPGRRVPGVGLLLSAGPPGPLKAQRPPPSSLDFKSDHHAKRLSRRYSAS